MKWKPCKRNDFIKKLRALGFEGAHSGAKSFYDSRTKPSNHFPEFRTFLNCNLFIQMNIFIRQADISDIQIICALGVTTFYEAYCLQDDSRDLAKYVLESFSAAQIETELNDEDSTFFIAEADGCAVGYAKLRENAAAECLRGENTVEIQRIYILEKMKGKRIGDALMRKCFDEARRTKLRIGLARRLGKKSGGAEVLSKIRFYKSR